MARRSRSRSLRLEEEQTGNARGEGIRSVFFSILKSSCDTDEITCMPAIERTVRKNLLVYRAGMASWPFRAEEISPLYANTTAAPAILVYKVHRVRGVLVSSWKLAYLLSVSRLCCSLYSLDSMLLHPFVFTTTVGTPDRLVYRASLTEEQALNIVEPDVIEAGVRSRCQGKRHRAAEDKVPLTHIC